MNPIPTYAELYDMILLSTEPYSKSEELYYAKRLVEAEAAIDRIYDTVLPSDDCYFTFAIRWKCKNALKTLYRYLLSHAEITDGRESLTICQSDLAAVFGYHAHTLSAARTLYEMLAEHRIIEPADAAPQRNIPQPVWLLPPEQWKRPDHLGRWVL